LEGLGLFHFKNKIKSYGHGCRLIFFSHKGMHNNFGKVRCPADKDLGMCMTNKIKKLYFPCKNMFKEDGKFSRST
jgi:hypothetical protein